MRSERYFLPPLELTDDELAALQTCLYLLEGKFAYAEPLRLALQNLALGRPGFAEAPTETALRVEVLDPDYSVEMQGRLGEARGRDLEAAHGQVPVLVDLARRGARAHGQPVRALPGRRRLVRRRRSTSTPRTSARSASRASAARSASPRAASATSALPAEFDVDRYRGRPPWQIGDAAGRGADRGGRRHGLVGRAHLRRRRSRTASS